MNKINDMFSYEGKTTKLIGANRTKTYNELYNHITDKQNDKSLSYNGDYLGDNELAQKNYLKEDLYLEDVF